AFAVGASPRTRVRSGRAPERRHRRRRCRNRRNRRACGFCRGAESASRGRYPAEQRREREDRMTRTRVDLGERGYDVVVGADAIDELASVLAGRRRAAVVTQAAIPDALVARAGSALERAGVGHETFVMGDGEDNKTLATVDDLCRRFARWGLLRGDAVVAL